MEMHDSSDWVRKADCFLDDCIKEQECVYKQKKKPGLRAGIGRELEERLGEETPIRPWVPVLSLF